MATAEMTETVSSGSNSDGRGRQELPNYFEETGVEPGTLEGVPGDYVWGQYKKLSKKDFANELAYQNYRLWHVDQRIAKISEEKDEIQAVIADLQKYDSEEKRAKVAKARAAQKRLAKLLGELDDEDIDYTDILSNLQNEVSK